MCVFDLTSFPRVAGPAERGCLSQIRQAGCNPVILSLLIAATLTITYVSSLSFALLPALLAGITREREVPEWMQTSSMAQVSRRSPSLSSSSLLPCSFFCSFSLANS